MKSENKYLRNTWHNSIGYAYADRVFLGRIKRNRVCQFVSGFSFSSSSSSALARVYESLTLESLSSLTFIQLLLSISPARS
ncbi:hypothetical protein Bca52824_025320 [Brassica carinata]|uniref:Uncharacterized protein n=1 Tax=Brassica carinata TaxID=52824 RepID=A0A8X8AWU4_BRACI|nr:hypothetical protein Bca52824_025320 [Brassica carinata]